MTTTEHSQDINDYYESYRDLLGFIPPRVQARFDMTGALAPDFLLLQEQMREHIMYSDVFDVKTTQLMLFGILLALMSDAARLHAIAARRAGASWEELHKVVELAFLFRGMSAANIGCELLAKLQAEEAAKP